MSETPPETTPEDEAKAAQRRRAWTYAIILTTTFVILGMVFAVIVFPDLHPLRAALAGACFGGFLALCSITYSAF